MSNCEHVFRHSTETIGVMVCDKCGAVMRPRDKPRQDMDTDPTELVKQVFRAVALVVRDRCKLVVTVDGRTIDSENRISVRAELFPGGAVSFLIPRVTVKGHTIPDVLRELANAIE